MSDAGMDMPMGDSSTSNGIPSFFDFQRIYWKVVGTTIAVATAANLLNIYLARQRPFFKTYATVTALAREIAGVTLPLITLGRHVIQLPPLGPVLIVLANLVLVLVLCFYGIDTLNIWQWENTGYRAGFVTIAQLPLVALLAGKRNLIGFFTGLGYERLNWFHRWVARTLWLTATIHMAFWFRDWGQYDYIVTMLTTDPISQRGLAAWCVLTFVTLTSLRPLRRGSYEVFVLLHIAAFSGFLVAIWFHALPEVRVWVWIAIGIVVFDRAVRSAWSLFANLMFFHPNMAKRESSHCRFWAHRASFTPLTENVTRVTIPDPVIRWQPGQHAFFTCHAIAPLQSHPFTIVSLPSDGKLEFLVRARDGGTKRFFRFASRHQGILDMVEGVTPYRHRVVFINGPYGTMRPLRQFDSVVFFAGGIGCSFTTPLLRDLVGAWKAEGQRAGSCVRQAVTQRIRFVWVVKSLAQLSWIESWLQAVLEDMDACRRMLPNFDKQLNISIYITCDEELQAKQPSPLPQANRSKSERPPNPISETSEKELENGLVSVRSSSASSLTDAALRQNEVGCQSGPQNCCCCRVIIEDDGADLPPRCTCGGIGSARLDPLQGGDALFGTPTADILQPTPHQKIETLTGRPDPQTIIRTVLEKAEGESAVVVCGPQGLGNDVRRSVVALSDERAVHKGTGAQGIYLHVETFGW